MSETHFDKIERCRKKVSFKLARRVVKVLYHLMLDEINEIRRKELIN